MKYNVKRLVVLGMLVAVGVVLSRSFLAINTELLKFNVAFIPVIIAAILYGPLWGGAVGALIDLAGALLFPFGPFNPSFTLTAFLTGVVFGIFLYNKKTKWLNASTAAAVVCVGLNMLLNSYFLYLHYLLWLGYAQDAAAIKIIAAMPSRVVTNTVIMIIQTVVIVLFSRAGAGVIKRATDEKLNTYRAKARGYFAGQPELRAEISREITERCLIMEEYKSAGTVFCFVGAEKEVDTKAILEAVLLDGKKLCVPRCESDHTMTARWIKSLDELSQKGAYGISEPSAETEIVVPVDIDLVFVPCSAADKKHYRLGKGGRYYDTYLKDTDMFKIALCPEELVVRSLPLKSHDVPVDRVATENRIF